MKIENNSASMALLAMQTSNAANKAKTDNSPALDTLINQNKDVPDTAKAPVVTGVKDNGLSKDTLGHLISATQESDAPNADIDTYNAALPVGVRHHLEQIANDPAYAKEQAKILGTSRELVFVGKELPTQANGYSPEESRIAFAKMKSNMLKMEQVRGDRTAYYEKMKDEGMPPAEIYAKLLEFNANLPKSHDDVLNWSESGQQLAYSDFQQASSDYFNNLFTKA